MNLGLATVLHYLKSTSGLENCIEILSGKTVGLILSGSWHCYVT